MSSIDENEPPTDVRLYPCKYCGAQENAAYGPFDVPWKTAQHVRNECSKAPKKRGAKASQQGATETTSQTPAIPISQEPSSQGKSPLFPSPPTPIDVMKKVLQDWDVDARVIERTAKIAERAGSDGLHPTELRAILRDMISGKSAKEIAYIVDDYHNGLATAEEDAREQGGDRPYGPLRRGGREYFDRQYPTRYSPSRPGSAGWGYDDYDERRSYYPERRSGEGVDDFNKRLESFRKEFLEEIRKSKEEDRVEKLTSTVTEVMNELKTIKENPPRAPETPLTENPFVLMLQEQVKLERENRAQERTDAKEARKELTDLITRQSDAIRELESKASRGHTDSYTDDNIRLAADALTQFGEIVRSRQPVKVVVEGVQGVLSGGTITPPEREKVAGESKVADKIPKEYLE